MTSLGATNNGAPVELYTCNGSANQDWVDIGTNKLVIENLGDDKCLNDSGGATGNYVPQTMWSCSGGTNETYNTAASGPPGLIDIIFAPGGNFSACGGHPCVLSSLGNAANYAPVELYTQVANDSNQEWGWPDYVNG